MKHQHTEQCREILSSISDYVDGTLEAELCRELEAHLEGCEDCRVVVDTFRKTVELYHTESQDELPADVKQRLYKRLNLEDLVRRQRQV